MTSEKYNIFERQHVVIINEDKLTYQIVLSAIIVYGKNDAIVRQFYIN